MKTNPEFLRQIWLQFSLLRLILTPVLLLLGAYAAFALTLQFGKYRLEPVIVT